MLKFLLEVRYTKNIVKKLPDPLSEVDGVWAQDKGSEGYNNSYM